MKRFLGALILSISLVSLATTAASAQTAHIPSVTKITASSLTTGTIVLEDTVVSRSAKYLALRRGDASITFTGTGTATRITVVDKASRLLFAGRINAIRIVGSADTTSAQKVVYLKANGF